MMVSYTLKLINVRSVLNDREPKPGNGPPRMPQHLDDDDARRSGAGLSGSDSDACAEAEHGKTSHGKTTQFKSAHR